MEHKKPSWLVKWISVLGSLLAAMWLLSCTAQVAPPTSIDEALLPSATYTSSPVPDPTPTPTGKQPTATPVSSPTAEPEPTATLPPPLDCGEAGALMFASGARGNDLYMACADGSAEQMIVPEESWLPDDTYFRGFALSPDAERVVVSANRGFFDDPVSDLFVIHLDDGSVAHLYHTTDYAIGNLMSWSPDGEYVGYAASDGYFDWLEVLHVESQTISHVATAESISGEAKRVVNVLSFDWSPKGTEIAYVAFLGGTPPDIKGYIADIDCASANHTCRGSNQRVLPWVNSWRTLTWAPDGASLSMWGYIETHQTHVLEIRRPGGELLQRIDLTDRFSQRQIESNSKTALSPDGNRIAIFLQGEDSIELFVLDLNTLEATRVSNRVNPANVQWFPGE